jgi:ubiquinol-cytochrome c reductase cytochrome c subunit
VSGFGRDMPRRARALGIAASAAVCGGLAVLHFAGVSTGQIPEESQSLQSAQSSQKDLVHAGRRLFVEGCSSCHGLDARGVEGQGPDLHKAGAAAADFYLRTGRMPLDAPGDEPIRAPPRYSNDEIEALVAYVGSLGGPRIPQVDATKGSLSDGMDSFALNCSGCHLITAQGGVVTGAYAPPLTESTPTDVGEAIRIGPYVMPNFSHRQIPDSEVNSIARYVQLTQQPHDPGGWGIGHIGPVPEGLVAWALAAVALLLVARLIGERIE